MRERRVRRRHIPAGEGAGADLNVVLGVVEALVHADAQGEQLEELPSVVLVEVGLVALGVVQVIHHSGVGGQSYQQVPEAAHAVVPEHVDHDAHFLAAVDLTVAGAEDHVPEESNLLLQLAGAVDHPVYPQLGVDLDGGSLVIGRVVPHQQVFVDAAAGVKQFFDHRVVAPSRRSFDVIPACPKAGAPQQVSYQCNILVSHVLLLLYCSSTSLLNALVKWVPR